jgi:hypothetical protein
VAQDVIQWSDLTKTVVKKMYEVVSPVNVGNDLSKSTTSHSRTLQF